MASLFRDEKGDAIQVVANDVTARKAAEEWREKLSTELAEKNRELESLIYIASHDLRAPLLHIQGFSQMLARDWQDIAHAMANCQTPEAAALRESAGAKIPRAIAFIAAGVERIDGLLEGLLRISRLGRAALRIEDTDMNQSDFRICSNRCIFNLSRPVPPSMSVPFRDAGAIVSCSDRFSPISSTTPSNTGRRNVPAASPSMAQPPMAASEI